MMRRLLIWIKKINVDNYLLIINELTGYYDERLLFCAFI
jgi:hypothetical protein